MTPELAHSEPQIISFGGVQVVIYLTRFARKNSTPVSLASNSETIGGIKSAPRLPGPTTSPRETSRFKSCHFLLIQPADNLINYVNSE